MVSRAYVAQRLLLVLPVILGISVVVFGALHLVQGDPARVMAGTDATEEVVQSLRIRYGLDQPVAVQFGIWLGHAVTGDLGTSIKSGRPVLVELGARYPNTLILAATSALLAIAIGLPAGVLAASRRGRATDRVTSLLALLGVCVPAFVLGLTMQLVFSVQLGWLPTTGTGSWKHLVAPTVTLAAFAVANFTRITRASVIEVLTQDYVRTAYSKGLSGRAVLARHALRNALLPVVTVVGVEVGHLLAGAVVVETVFGYPGVGRYLVDAIMSRDYPSVQATVLVLAGSWVLVNLVVDLLYTVVDPRVTLR